MDDGPEWFAPKRYGYGSGLPISWQGWAVTILYLIIAISLSARFGREPAKMIAAIALPTVVFVVICARTTHGGFRWRWGGDDK